MTGKMDKLVFCAAPAWQTMKLAESLDNRAGSPGNTIFLVPREGETGRRLLETGRRVVIGGWDGMFETSHLPDSVDKTLSSAGFKEIVIVCDNHNGDGYEKIIDYCRSLGAERIGLVCPDMLYRPIIPDGGNGSHTFSFTDGDSVTQSMDDMFYKERAYPQNLSEEPLWDDFGAIFETTFLCNYECVHCPRNVAGLDTSRSIDPQVFEKFIEDKRIGHITLLGLGETLMNPGFEEISKSIRRKKVPTAIVTNGSYISAGKLNHLLDIDLTLVVSMDGAEEDIFGHLRKHSQLARIRENIATLLAEHPGVEVIFNTVVSVDNYNHIDKVVELAADLGVGKVNLLNVLALDKKSGDCHWFCAPSPQRMEGQSKALARAGKLGVDLVGKPSRPSMRTCLSPWNQMYVTMNGDVYPCSFIYRIPSETFDEYFMNSKAQAPLEAFRIGNLNKDSLSNIWNGPKIREIRRILLDSQRNLQLDLADYLKLREDTPKDNPLDYCRTCLNRWNCAC